MLFSEVSAVIVTRGNTDLAPVLASLERFDEVVVWDNSVRTNHMTFGRICGFAMTVNNVIYSQDDDIIHSPDNQQRILDAYEPGVLTGCMWPEWSAGAKEQGIPNGYDDLVFPGSGSVCGRGLLEYAGDRYLEHWPFDDFYRLWSDTIVGILAPTKQLNIQFDALPEAEADYRMCNLPNAVEQKAEAIRRAREIRDRKLSGRELRIAAAMARVAA